MSPEVRGARLGPDLADSADVILFTLAPCERLADAFVNVPNVARRQAVLSRFANGELQLTLDTSVAECDCCLLGAVAPPDEHLLATLLLGDTLRREGARRVTVLLPYLGYARQDRAEPRTSLGAAWVGSLLHAVGIADVVTVDVHSPHVAALFPIPLQSLSPAPLLAAELRILPLTDPTIVAPDEGARERCEAVRTAAGLDRPVAYFVKKRTAAGVVHSARHGSVGRQAVIVDDILDTGGTLLSACEALHGSGVEEIVVMVTHGLFTGSRWQRLQSLGVSRVYCTDTVPSGEAMPGVVRLSVAPLLRQWLCDRAAAERPDAETPR